MKLKYAFWLTMMFGWFDAFCQTMDTLPPGVPDPLTPEGKYSSNMMFTTKAYQKEAFRLVLQEANKVAKELHLSEQLPISEEGVIDAFIAPFGYAWVNKSVGNITTPNYCYSVSHGNKFCYLDRTDERKDYQLFQKKYLWPLNQMDTNAAYCLATQWLGQVLIDVAALSRDFPIQINVNNPYYQAPPGKFVPIYKVAWCKKQKLPEWLITDDRNEWTPVASVTLCLPTKTLLELRVEDPKYILRPPLVITNLAELFPGQAKITTNYPSKPKIIDGSSFGP